MNLDRMYSTLFLLLFIFFYFACAEIRVALIATVLVAICVVASLWHDKQKKSRKPQFSLFSHIFSLHIDVYLNNFNRSWDAELFLKKRTKTGKKKKVFLQQFVVITYFWTPTTKRPYTNAFSDKGEREKLVSNLILMSCLQDAISLPRNEQTS